jgi:hypothetical protein
VRDELIAGISNISVISGMPGNAKKAKKNDLMKFKLRIPKNAF